MKVNKFRIVCPECHLSAVAELDSDFQKFIIYTCPRCHHNVVYYKNKVETLSDKMVKKLLRSGKLKFCGKVIFKDFRSSAVQSGGDDKRTITEDDVTNLKILLETEKDAAKIISRL